jgi:hypothetical protein
MSRVVANQIWNVQVLSRIAPRDTAGAAILSRSFTDKQLESVSAAALQACDALDGIADGMINDFKAGRLFRRAQFARRTPLRAVPVRHRRGSAGMAQDASRYLRNIQVRCL